MFYMISVGAQFIPQCQGYSKVEDSLIRKRSRCRYLFVNLTWWESWTISGKLAMISCCTDTELASKISRILDTKLSPITTLSSHFSWDRMSLGKLAKILSSRIGIWSSISRLTNASFSNIHFERFSWISSIPSKRCNKLSCTGKSNMLMFMSRSASCNIEFMKSTISSRFFWHGRSNLDW